MVNFGLLTAEIGSGVWGTPTITGFASWQRYCMASSSGRRANFPALNTGHWLVRMECRPARWMVGVSASVNLPLHHKVKKFSSGTGSPGWFWKKGRKTAVVVRLMK